MKTKTSIIVQLFEMFISVSGFAQGTLQNLDFEQADPVFVNGNSGPYVTATSALPYWTPEIGGVPQTQILENVFSLGSPQIVLLTSTSPQPPLDGDYSVLLTGSGETASISQTGQIPFGTESLFFEAQKGSGGGGNGNLTVMIGTQTVSTVPVAFEPNFTLYGANISAWAGDTEQLTFAASPTMGQNTWEIDDISLSTTAVTPEPSALALTGIGGLLFALYRRFAPKYR
jgi:hypothetical protein